MFHCDRKLQVYMYDFMYVDPDKIPMEDYFPATRTFKKISTPGPVPNNWPVFSYIRSDNYQLDLNFDETETKIQSYHTSKDKVKLFCENILFIEEYLFDDMNLTGGATFLTSLIKCEKSRFNL